MKSIPYPNHNEVFVSFVTLQLKLCAQGKKTCMGQYIINKKSHILRILIPRINKIMRWAENQHFESYKQACNTYSY